MSYSNTTVPFPEDRLGHPNHHDLNRSFGRPSCDPLIFLKDFEKGALNLLEEHGIRERLSYSPRGWGHQGGGTTKEEVPRAPESSLRSGHRYRRDGYGYPEVICKPSSTSLYSFFAFAILMLDITGNIMATIDISINVTGSTGTVTTNNTNINNNTNTNNNNNNNNNG
ncbi:protein FAM91 homolog, partial [Penaeus monodon]|uniref:protein FAM91 homolog n=1 Tax=Penaeus monodon TaxID=6687 RepID=UPI0018A78791